MPVNWNLGVMPDVGGNALNAFRTARQDVRQEQREDEATALRREEIGVRRDAMAASTADAARKRQSQQVVMAGRLAGAVKAGKLDPSRGLQIAQQQGLDVSDAPPPNDPGFASWLDETIAISALYEKDDGETISGIARELQDAGYDLKSPEGQQAMRGVIQNKYAAEYVDEQGNTRRRTALNLPGGQGGPQPGVVEDGYRFKGGNPADPNAWEPVAQGGGVSNGTGGFQP